MILNQEFVVLVNESDEEIGTMEKMQAHQEGQLHRAFSIFIFNDKNQLLLQKRNPKKYHSGGLWTNTCCGHPRPGEKNKEAAIRRLKEEMGFTTLLQKEFGFIYKANFENGLTEYEFDHVYYGKFKNYPEPNSLEVSDWKYMDWDKLVEDIEINPQNYTVWFRICVDKISDRMLMQYA
ncbi:MAG: isopentenyl-diphosphate Delta-isomerase [Bacteroidetes bacterium]|nr:MAG: isopentenyl-diphosphate Delta-isomerase [Bacteroidota bacterium]